MSSTASVGAVIGPLYLSATLSTPTAAGPVARRKLRCSWARCCCVGALTDGCRVGIGVARLRGARDSGGHRLP